MVIQVNHIIIKPLILLVFALIACLFNQLFAENSHQHQTHDDDFIHFDSHVHGEATANITFIASTLIIELQLPAINVFGFEHQAKNSQEQQIVNNRLLELQQASNVIDTTSDCHTDSVVVESNSNLPHDKNNGLLDNEHSDISATYQYHCEDNNEIKLSFILFNKMNSLHKILVQSVTEQQQNSFTVTRERPMITLH